MLGTVRTYKVWVDSCKSRSGKRDIFFSRTSDYKEFYNCIEGIIYACTDDPIKIYDKFGNGTVLGIEEVDYEKESGQNVLYAIFNCTSKGESENDT